MKTQPLYPPEAIEARLSGTVVLDATVAGTGVVADVRVLSGPPMLQQESLKAVKTWRYRPYVLNGIPTVRKFKINIIFTLEEDGSRAIRTTQSEPETVKILSPADDVKTQDNRSPSPIAPVKISAGVAGGVTARTQPVYPPIAKAARVSGTVVLEATISKTGIISDIRVVSGPPLLQQASLDAVRVWRYRPFMVKSLPAEAKTIVNVVFTLAEDGTATAKATGGDLKPVEPDPYADDSKQPESK